MQRMIRLFCSMNYLFLEILNLYFRIDFLKKDLNNIRNLFLTQINLIQRDKD